jgi:hypothetical protein
MSILARSLPLIAVLLCVGGSMADGGLCNRGASCGDSCAAECCTNPCCPSDYCCKCESEEVDLKRHCFETECKPVVVPAIKMPCCKCKLKNLFRGRRGSNSGCGGCGHNCGGGLLSNLCSKLTKCKVRCVNTYEKKEYKCGKKCVCKWSVEPKCGSGSGCCDTGASCAADCCAPVGCTQ